MPDLSDPRRRAPYWVRSLADIPLHGLTGKLARVERWGDGSEAQGWLLGACISELEYRARRDRRDHITPCACQWCCEPFPDDDDQGEPEPF